MVSSSVWFITSASKAPPPAWAAVRQAPLTETESPGSSSLARSARTRMRAPSSEASTASTLPSSATIPVNTATTPAAEP